MSDPQGWISSACFVPPENKIFCSVITHSDRVTAHSRGAFPIFGFNLNNAKI